MHRLLVSAMPVWATATIVLAALGVLSHMPGAIGLVVALPMVLLLPGYALCAATGRASDGLRTFVMALALSFAVCIVGMMAMSVVARLDGRNVAVMLGLVTLGCWHFARRSVPDRRGFALSQTIRPGLALAFTAAIFLAAGSIMLARSGAQAHQQFAWTDFWMVAAGTADRRVATIGVINREQTTARYEVEILADGALIARLPAISLAIGERQESVWAFPPFARATRVEANLYRDGDRSASYRRVWLNYPGVQAEAVE